MVNKSVTVNDHSLVYDAYGEGDIGVIFLHGLCGDRNIWKYNASEVANSLPLKSLAIDYFGHGDSTKSITGADAFNLRTLAIIALAEKENLSEIILIGHSIAGLLMERIIDEMSIKACCFVDCAKNSDELIKGRRTVIAEKLEIPAGNLNEATADWLMEYSLVKSPELVDLIRNPVFKMKSTWPYEFMEATNKNYTPQRTNLPVMVMQANFISWDDKNTSFAHHYPNCATSHFDVKEHYFFLTERERFNAEITDWLKVLIAD